MAREVQKLNLYSGTDDTGNAIVVTAEDMETAATVYKQERGSDPVMLQITKRGVRCALPDIYVSFTAEAFDQTTQLVVKTCKVTPEKFSVLGGTKQIFTATPAAGYRFVKWQINGEDVIDDENNLVTDTVTQLTIPATDYQATIRAVFEIAA